MKICHFAKKNIPRIWSMELFGKFPKIITFGGMFLKSPRVLEDFFSLKLPYLINRF
jgi:hypothetical protein